MDTDTVAFWHHAPDVLIGIGAVSGLIASAAWLKVHRSKTPGVGDAALWTAGALGLASLGYLVGRLTGTF